MFYNYEYRKSYLQKYAWFIIVGNIFSLIGLSIAMLFDSFGWSLLFYTCALSFLLTDALVEAAQKRKNRRSWWIALTLFIASMYSLLGLIRSVVPVPFTALAVVNLLLLHASIAGTMRYGLRTLEEAKVGYVYEIDDNDLKVYTDGQLAYYYPVDELEAFSFVHVITDGGTYNEAIFKIAGNEVDDLELIWMKSDNIMEKFINFMQSFCNAHGVEFRMVEKVGRYMEKPIINLHSFLFPDPRKKRAIFR